MPPEIAVLRGSFYVQYTITLVELGKTSNGHPAYHGIVTYNASDASPTEVSRLHAVSKLHGIGCGYAACSVMNAAHAQRRPLRVSRLH